MLIRSKQADYQILIKEDLSACASALCQELKQKLVFVITNETVYSLYSRQMEKILQEESFHWIVIKDGEEYKNWTTFQQVVEQIDALGISRSSVIIGFGGGVVGDIAAFVASTILRGVEYIAVPTSLLAMVDSSIGGKTGINTKEGKNRLGTFYPPRMVFMPLACLQTLPPKEIKCGLGEIVKHGILGSERILELLEKNASSILQIDLDLLKEIIYLSCQIKGAIVMEDEREAGIRKALNLGHTIGHSIEKVLNYSGITHGEAVAIGLVAELRWMVSKEILSQDILQRIISLFKKLDMSTSISDIDREECVRAISFDKKRKYDMIVLPVVEKIGLFQNTEVYIDDIPEIVEHILTGDTI